MLSALSSSMVSAYAPIILYMAKAETIGERIKRLREAAKIEPKDFAAYIGISPQGLGQLENGKTKNPRPQTLRLAAKRLGLSMEELSAPGSTPSPSPQATPSPVEVIGAWLDTLPPEQRQQTIVDLLSRALSLPSPPHKSK